MFALDTADTFLYRIVFLLHILSIIVAFAPGFVVSVVNTRYKRDGGSLASEKVATYFSQNTAQVHGPALALAGVFGIGLIGLSDGKIEFSQAWISIALLLWFVMLGVVFALLLPSERKVASGDRSAEPRATMFGGIIHLLLLLMLIDMIWKPGL